VTFEPLDVVRVTRLLLPSRDVDGATAEPPQPQLGQRATVVDSLGDGLYLVERVTDDGLSLWVAEFHEDELELVDRAAEA
jgi:hypothetical protein